MKIAIFSATLPKPGVKPGGVDIAIDRLANQLAANPLDSVTIYSLDASPTDRRYKHVQLFSRSKILRRSKLARLFCLPALLNVVDFSQYDVVHLHGDDWFYWLRRTATVRTLHGSALSEARTATSLKRRVLLHFIYPLEHLSRRLATVALGVGPATGRIYSVDRIANNGVDPQVFFPSTKTDYPQILYVGTWEGRKRGWFAFKQFVEVILPAAPTAKLIMVSDSCAIHPSVQHVKTPDDASLAKLFRESWVFMYPSIYEGFGIPYVESMASGTVVVCSENDGANYVLKGGICGKVTNDQDFGAAVVSLLNDQMARESLERIGFERSKDFHWENVARQHREVYEEALKMRVLAR